MYSSAVSRSSREKYEAESVMSLSISTLAVKLPNREFIDLTAWRLFIIKVIIMSSFFLFARYSVAAYTGSKLVKTVFDVNAVDAIDIVIMIAWTSLIFFLPLLHTYGWNPHLANWSRRNATFTCPSFIALLGRVLSSTVFLVWVICCLDSQYEQATGFIPDVMIRCFNLTLEHSK